MTRGEEVNNPDEVGFLGGIFGDANYEAYEDYDGPGAAMSVSFSTPNEKNVNFSITGPNGYRNSIEVGYFGLETGGDARVLENLTPGVYSVAATDDNLQLVRTNLELRVSSLIPLNFNLQLIEDFDYNIADYEPYEAYGTYEIGEYSPVDVASGGNVTVLTSTSDGADDVEVLVSITGPDDFIQDFEGSERVFTGLTEGPYSVAATAEGYGMVEGIVESREGQVVEVTLTLEPLGSAEDSEDEEDDD